MKTDRLLAIVMILLGRREITAGELAERFEVSIRTIYRDVGVLSTAGIPIEQRQGRNGGIRLREGYRMDRTFMTPEEIETLQASLKGVAAVLKDSETKAFSEKLAVLNRTTGGLGNESFVLDLEPWGMESSDSKEVERLRKAARDRKRIIFEYQAVGADQTQRTVEPYAVIFKGFNWYLYGYCMAKADFRLFRVSRMRAVEVTERTFEPRPVDLDSRPWDTEWYHPQNQIQLWIRIPNRCLLHYQEWLKNAEADSADENYTQCKIEMPQDEGLYRFLLSFSGDIEVLAPQEVRDELACRAQKIYEIHKK